MFSNTFGDDSYLIDNCGRLINKWTGEKPNGLSSALLKDGTLLRAYKESGSNIFQPSVGGGLEILSWEGEILWQYKEAGENYIQHHDFAIMPNGNILFIGWEAIATTELAEMGMNTDMIFTSTVWFEYIKEIKPNGTDTELIWEWHMIDHVVQDQIPDLDNYGIIADHPHKFNLNYTSELQFSVEDPYHANAIDYDPIRDEIVLNVRSIGELWILDHSTTTEEAAGETGGQSGKGGDLLFRWGNPAAYDRQISEDDWMLFGAHGTNFVDPGLPDAGKIIFFNNGVLRPDGMYSTVEMIEPLLDANQNYVLNSDGQFAISSHDIIFGEEQNLVSLYEANAHQLPDGHFYINETERDRLLQVNQNQEIVWEYKIPLFHDFVLDQSDSSSFFLPFVSLRYAADFEGFEDQDVTPGELIETNPSSDFCSILSLEDTASSSIYLSSESGFLEIQSDVLMSRLEVMNLNGQLLVSETVSNRQQYQLDLMSINNGIYIVRIWDHKGNMYVLPFNHFIY